MKLPSRNILLIGTGIALVLVALLLTVFNKRWWLRRAERKWKLTRTVVEGVTWLKQPYLPMEEFREDYLLAQPLRRLRELYDTGGLKDPAPIGEAMDQEAPATDTP